MARRSMRVGSGSPVRDRICWSASAIPPGHHLSELLDVAEGTLAEIEARSLLNRLAAKGLLSVRLLDDHGIAATIAVPVLPDEPLAPAAELVLSDDVLIRRASGGAAAGVGRRPGSQRSDRAAVRRGAARWGAARRPGRRRCGTPGRSCPTASPTNAGSSTTGCFTAAAASGTGRSVPTARPCGSPA